MCQKMGQIVGAVLEIWRFPFFADVSRKMAKNWQKTCFTKNRKNFVSGLDHYEDTQNKKIGIPIIFQKVAVKGGVPP